MQAEDRPPSPTITLSYAQTLDGRIATSTGSSQWISGGESLRYTHEIRARHDAIMVGVGTVLRDDPQLTVRLVPGRSPLRIVVDSLLRTPPDARVLSAGAPGALIAVTSAAPAERVRRIQDRGAEVLMLPAGVEGGVDLRALIQTLAARGVGSVMAEGGARLITSMLRERLATRLAVCVAPKLLGSGIEAVGDLSKSSLSESVQVALERVTRLGDDLMLEGALTYPECGR